MMLNMHQVKIIWYFFRPHWVRSGLLLFIMVFSGFMEMLNLAVLYPIVNYGLDLEKNTVILKAFDRFVNLFTADRQLFVSCIILIVVTVITVGSRIAYNYLSNKLTLTIVGDVQKGIFRKFSNADYGFFVGNQQGKLIHMGMVAPDYIANAALFIIRFSYDFIQFLFLFSLLFALTWQGTLAILTIGAVYFLFVKRILERVIYKCASIANEEDRKKNVILNEFINGIKPIKIFTMENSWERKYVDTVNRKLDNY
ncbi:MAG: ABC transporter transmembrane domain-containing protein, partial [Candidatus Omnitrophica bacterium]|nr:ABC transporter transmembrane domain-containing protein [Candidatus Omnitrophota bacterium]